MTKPGDLYQKQQAKKKRKISFKSVSDANLRTLPRRAKTVATRVVHKGVDSIIRGGDKILAMKKRI